MSLYTLCAVYKLLTGKIGMGNGDFKLLAALGAWLGIGILPVLIFMVALVGLVGALIARVGKGHYLLFGPSLAVQDGLFCCQCTYCPTGNNGGSYNQDDNDFMDSLTGGIGSGKIIYCPNVCRAAYPLSMPIPSAVH